MTREELELFAWVRDTSTCAGRRRPCAPCSARGHDVATLSEASALSLVQALPSAQLFWRPDGTVAAAGCLHANTRTWALPRRETVARVLLTGAVVLLVLAALVTLFGDNLRKLYGMSSGCLPGEAVFAQPPRPSSKSLRTFAASDSY